MSSDEVSPEVRRRVEERHRDSTWKIFVCAEKDGEKCVPSSSGVHLHECRAGKRHRRDPQSPVPLVVWIDVVPKTFKKK